MKQIIDDYGINTIKISEFERKSGQIIAFFDGKSVFTLAYHGEYKEYNFFAIDKNDFWTHEHFKEINKLLKEIIDANEYPIYVFESTKEFSKWADQI